MRKLKHREDRQEKSDHKTVAHHENNIAEAIGGQAVGTKGSRQLGQKRSDAQSERYEVECKQTGKQSISLKMEWLLDISRLARGNKRIPLVSLRFLKRDQEVEKDWVLMPLSEFKKLKEAAGEIRNDW